MTAQVQIAINDFSPGGLTIPHVPMEMAIHDAIQTMVIQKARTLSS